jgi:hypothetical protein
MILIKKLLPYSVCLTVLLTTQASLAESKWADAEHKKFGDTITEGTGESTNPVAPYIEAAAMLHSSLYKHLRESDDFVKLESLANVLWQEEFDKKD